MLGTFSRPERSNALTHVSQDETQYLRLSTGQLYPASHRMILRSEFATERDRRVWAVGTPEQS